MALEDERWTSESASVGPGWAALVDDAITDMYALDPDIIFLQIKEKFGYLCIYFSTTLEQDSINYRLLDKVVGYAELIAVRTCIKCGKYGNLEKEKRGYGHFCVNCVNS